ncbi:MAG TPA: DUF4450 domain-containing protein [Pelobium sp.]|nr:DUF4450 domain-containing protein [Pelobium sp.]
MKNKTIFISRILTVIHKKELLLLLIIISPFYGVSQEKPLWHNTQRSVRYQPTDQGFKGVNLERKFNRALYGTNTGFRVEAGDQPEFALYLPGMGGNLKLGFKIGNIQKWLTDADSVIANYNPGEMFYEIKDRALGKAIIHLELLAYADTEGMILKITAEGLNQPITMFTSYGGVNGQKFSRDGDLGADPESVFYLKPEYCRDNQFKINTNQFQLDFYDATARKEIAKGNKPNYSQVYGQFPKNAQLKVSDVSLIANLNSFSKGNASNAPVLTANFPLKNQEPTYIAIQRTSKFNLPEQEFVKAKTKIKALTDRVILKTPDKWLNNYGAALAIAADGIWEEPSYIHGSVAWRMHLNGWRGAYVADPLGWHDRAKMHFESYAASQYLEPKTGPVVADTALHLARQKEVKGTSLFSEGYISRNPGKQSPPHHYDMNLGFIDQLLRHFFYTGNLTEIKDLWPEVKRHLAWEKRNFDSDNDGLYDAYASIWASDALQYSGGAVTHSSAYNYKANLLAAKIAKLVNENPAPYQKEADKILNAINSVLWMKDLGRYAEYKDALGNQLLHSSAGLWTVYHAIDSDVPNPEQAYQLVKYVNENIPHIPIKATGLTEDFYTISTTNWQPYTWSINNVATAEVLHTALAFWQANQADEAYKLWKGSVLENMYLGASPGNFGQVSFYDANRGELYRDFADPIGMAARSLTEGLFGIDPDAINDTLTIKPGFPTDWNYASLHLPDIEFDYQQKGSVSNYSVTQQYSHLLNLKLQLYAKSSKVKSVLVNGEKANYQIVAGAVKYPMIQIEVPKNKTYQIVVEWDGDALKTEEQIVSVKDGSVKINLADYQSTVQNEVFKIADKVDDGYLFIPVEQGDMSWQLPVKYVRATQKVKVQPANYKAKNQVKVNLNSYFNSNVTDIFKNEYLSPRPKVPTLQLPTQGIGNWCYPLVTANIDDWGFRNKLQNNAFTSPEGIIFSSPAKGKNIIYTSMWDNYPDSAVISLQGNATHAYLVMAGSTNPMQSRFINGLVKVNYTDGSQDILELKNPENWWPIEQDFVNDGFAFTTDAPKPYRLYLKTGEITKDFKNYTSIKGFSNKAVDGGAATLLDMPLNPNKKLKNLVLVSRANDVVIGLMALTLTN